KYTFFHNAGWLGINFRKMTPAVILAFDAISKMDSSLSLLVHSQVELEKLPDFVVKIVENNPQIDFRVETVPAPGLYHLGKIYVYPTKLEGLGLTVVEALSCGLPVITTDAPPMNEFVRDGYNGLLVDVAKKITRQDVVAFPEELVDLNDLAWKMYQLAKDKDKLKSMADNAQSYTNSALNWERFNGRVKKVAEGCVWEKMVLDEEDIRLDICGGESPIRKAFFLDGTPVGGNFLNVDIRDIPGVDIKANLRGKLPFEDNSVLEIFSSGTIEHFNLREIPFILKEFHRILLPGGAVVVCVPNLNEITRKYAQGLIDFKILNQYFYGDQANPFDLHKAVFDKDNLKQILKSAGFVDIVSEPFDIKFHIPELMLKVIAMKPGGLSGKRFIVAKRYDQESNKPEKGKTRKHSIVMLIHNQLEHTRRAIESIIRSTEDFELVLVDNGSFKETADYLREVCEKSKMETGFDVKYLRNEENLSVAMGWNQGIKASSAETVAVVNNDIVFTSGWLDKMSVCLVENVALVGPMNNASGAFQVIDYAENISYEEINRRLEEENKNKSVFNITDKEFLSGFCMVTKREIFERIGYFDENFKSFLYEDTDFERRLIDEGYRIVVNRTTFVYHVGQATMLQFTDKFMDVKERNAEYFAKKHNAELIIDDNYTPRTKEKRKVSYVTAIS
ncbi:MAG: glycosyltransferase, partial [candidate division Zixibacteria bacterium]|nr:glycosyltransferase [candidate division Zixibacteria bacterium]